MADETYDPARVERLREMLRALARRLQELDAGGRLLDDPGALLQALGDARAELFQYEVRITFDSPEIAEHRRIVREAEGWRRDEDDQEEQWQADDP